MRFSVRGFTLFTALVGFVLIGLGFLLANSMLHSEENLQKTIASIDEQSEMQSLSDLMQADAFQYLNWHFRAVFEDYISSDESANGYAYQLNYRQGDNLEDFIDNYSKATLQSSALARFLTEGLTNSFTGPGRTFKNYRVCLISCDEDGQNAWLSIHTNKLHQNLQELIEEEVRQKKLFEPVDCKSCDNGQCTNGSFYINLDLTLRYQDGTRSGLYVISDADLENFPQISIESQSTGRIIRQPILPRNHFRMYVPNRFLKAICSASEIAKNNFFSNNNNISQLKKIGLGFCDPGVCAPRTNPFEPQTNPTTISGKMCPGTVVKTCQPNEVNCVADRLSDIVLNRSTLQSVALSCTGSNSAACSGKTYDPNRVEDMKEKLLTLLGGTASSVSGGISANPDGENYGPDQDFTLETSNAILNFTTVQSHVIETRKIILNYPEANPNHSGIGKGYCVKPIQVGTIVGFKEHDPKYTVLDKSAMAPGKDHIYRIFIGSGASNQDIEEIPIENCTSSISFGNQTFPGTAPITSLECGKDGVTCQCTP